MRARRIAERRKRRDCRRLISSAPAGSSNPPGDFLGRRLKFLTIRIRASWQSISRRLACFEEIVP